jgi:G:T-mismatch repair DNA endonuclease (very short patch repair protein)
MAQRLCEECKQPFTPNPKQHRTQQAKQRFCSILCRNTANSKARPRIKGTPCAQCGRIAYDRTNAVCRFCRAWTPEQDAYIREHYPHQGPQVVADALGLSMKSVRNHANKIGVKLTKTATRRLVNAKARQHMMRDNPMKRPGAGDRVRAWYRANPDKVAVVREKLMEGQQRLQRNKPSKLEHRLRAILDSLGIQHEPSALIKPNFVVDIRIGSLILQADGEYWHGHPRFEPLTERQQKQRARDAAQDTYLRACGYTVVRIWERDVTTEHIAAILRDMAPTQTP